MNNEDRVETGVVEFIYNNGDNDTCGLYLRNEDVIKYKKSLEFFADKLADHENNMLNASLYIEINKIIDILSKIENPKKITFIETNI
jgi:hypothetical protein